MLFRTPALAALAAVLGLLFAESAAAQGSPSEGKEDSAAGSAMAAFNAWRDRFRARALKAGIPHDVFEKALGDVRPDPRVHEENATQPEFTRPVWDYLDGALSATRIENGRKMLRKHASLLAEAERAHGVPRRFLVAIWGMETSYGALLGKHNIFEALATLSYTGNRQAYGEEQLLAALRLLADGHKSVEAMKGSWAGAVGHTQFVPTTYLKYAVDGDKDGRVDLWDSLSDVFHSTARYLKESGFDRNFKWGREAMLPDGFDYALAGDHVTKPLSEWRSLGVKMADGSLVPDMDIPASILLPAGHQGPAFLVYENFQALLTYNRSISYALAIGLLSDQIQGWPGVKKSWPRHLRPLSKDERLEIQQRLADLGYEPGKADGVLGRGTRDAIRAFQKDRGEIADGYATAELLTQLRGAGPKPSGDTASRTKPEPEKVSVASPAAEETASPQNDGAPPNDAGAAPAAAAADDVPVPAAAAANGVAPQTAPVSGAGAATPALASSAVTAVAVDRAEGWRTLYAVHEAAHAENIPIAQPAASDVAERGAQPAGNEAANDGAARIPVSAGTAGEQAKAVTADDKGEQSGSPSEPSGEDESEGGAPEEDDAPGSGS